MMIPEAHERLSTAFRMASEGLGWEDLRARTGIDEDAARVMVLWRWMMKKIEDLMNEHGITAREAAELSNLIRFGPARVMVRTNPETGDAKIHASYSGAPGVTPDTYRLTDLVERGLAETEQVEYQEGMAVTLYRAKV